MAFSSAAGGRAYHGLRTCSLERPLTSPRLAHACYTTRRHRDRQRRRTSCDRLQTQASEDNMNENRDGRNPNWRLLLLVPAAVLIAQIAKSRPAMWQTTVGASRGPPRPRGWPQPRLWGLRRAGAEHRAVP